MPTPADTFKEFVLEQLERLPDVSCNRMFGAYGLYSGEIFFGIISKSRLYFKTDKKTRVAYIERKSTPFRPNPKVELQKYYEVPLEILEDRDQLVQWARLAVCVSAPPKRNKSQSGKR
ncbi:MAG TPA: TfoX/Sxy family protein [Terriglobia bacterium]|nr:TfoX/Sxy family protein [Terriglobia bacterium]